MISPWRITSSDPDYWVLLEDHHLDGVIGFVYEIVNETTGKRYIGKKLLTKSKAYQVKGKKKKKRVESDWKSYTGSNEELNADVALGHNIVRNVLHLCKSKGWMSYYETKEIMVKDAIISEKFYNSWCSAKIRQNHLRVK